MNPYISAPKNLLYFSLFLHSFLLIYFILAEILFQPKRQISSCGEDKTIVY
jgi:hypothetical protein